MTRSTRRAVIAGFAGIVTAGCVTGDSPTDDPGSSPTDLPSETPREESPTGGVTHGSNRPDPDHAIYLSNRGAEVRTVRVRVTREATGESVFDETYDAEPGIEREVYNLQQADPDGIEAFSVCGELLGATPGTREPTEPGSDTPESPPRDCVAIRTNACYGSAHVTVGSDGGLRVIYAVC